MHILEQRSTKNDNNLIHKLYKMVKLCQTKKSFAGFLYNTKHQKKTCANEQKIRQIKLIRDQGM